MTLSGLGGGGGGATFSLLVGVSGFPGTRFVGLKLRRSGTGGGPGRSSANETLDSLLGCLWIGGPVFDDRKALLGRALDV